MPKESTDEELVADAVHVIKHELMSGGCYLCVEQLAEVPRALLVSIETLATVGGPYLPSDYEFLRNSKDWKWTQFDATTWFVIASGENRQKSRTNGAK